MLSPLPVNSIEYLLDFLKKRKMELPEKSYSTTLFRNRKKLSRKIIEEAFEVTISENWSELKWELADLLYFMLVMSVYQGVEYSDVIAELGGRHNG